MSDNQPQDNNRPKVSILIPVFNREEFIGDCIESALNQTYKDFEIIIFDNASTDNTWEICKKFALTDRRIKIFRQGNNIGPVRNWISCAQQAKGEFAKFLYSDDLLERNCLIEMVPKLINQDIGLVYSSARIGKSIEDSHIYYSNPSYSTLTRSELINFFLTSRAPVSPGVFLMRTDDLRENIHDQFPTSTYRDFNKNGAGPDVMIMLLTALKYPYAIHIPAPLGFLRIHATSFTTQNLNGELPSYYKSAISLFLKKNYYSREWINYLSEGWLRDIRIFKKWINPRAFLREFEGSGSVSEVMTLLYFSIFHILNRLENKIFKNDSKINYINDK